MTSSRRAESEKQFERALKVIPGGVNSPARAFGAVGGHPLIIDRGEGQYLYDIDGNRYIDFVGSWGPHILGHRHPQVIARIEEALQKGTSFGAPTLLETELAELVGASCARYFEEMAKARDDRVWQDAAHGMKGAARGIGANEVGRLAGFAEKLVGQAQASRRAETLTQLRAAAERVNVFFTEHLKGA